MGRSQSVLTAGVAALFISTHPVDAAPKPLLERAVVSACRLDLRGTLVSIIQHGEDGSVALIREQAAGWPARFSRFAVSPQAKVLRAYAEARHRDLPSASSAYDAATCRRLKPLAAPAQSAVIVSEAYPALKPGHLLLRCTSGLCAPPAVAAIADRCDFVPLAIPLEPLCP